MAKLPPLYRATIEIEYRSHDRAAAGKAVREQIMHLMQELINNPLIQDPGISGTASEEVTR